MAVARRKWAGWVLPAGAAVLAVGAGVAVPALAGSGPREQAKTPTLAVLAQQVKGLRAQDATLRKRVAALSKKGSVVGVTGSVGAQGPPGAQGAAGAPGTLGGVDAYTRAESDARFVQGSTTDALVRLEVAPSATSTLVDLGPLGRLEGTCGNLSSPPGAILQPPASQVGAIDVVADTGVVNPMTGTPSPIFHVIDATVPTPADLPGTGQSYHAIIHVAQGVGPGARLAALDVTGFKITATAVPCQFTVRMTTAGLG